MIPQAYARSTMAGWSAAGRREARRSRARLAKHPLHGVTGIAHTRWATHGAPTVGNAHPHIIGAVALVHNGIIENFKPLRDELIAEGRKFESETDTEVVGHLVARELERGASPQDAVSAVLPRLTGAFAIAFLFRDHPELIIGLAGRSADRRLWRWRELSRLGRASSRAMDAAHRLSRRGRLGDRSS